MHALTPRTPVTHLFASTALALGLASCADLEGGDETTLGERGRVGFAYDRSCFFDCPIEQPLLVGTRETIQLTGPGDDEGIRARTSDDDLIELAVERDCFCERRDGHPGRLEIADDATCEDAWRKHCDNLVLVRAKKAGDARLELRDHQDELVDAIELHLRKAHAAAFFATHTDRLGTQEATSLELAEGEQVDLEVELYDAQGLVLLAPEGVTWRIEDDGVASVSAWLIGTGAEVEAGLTVTVQARAPGTTDVHVVVPGLDASIPLRVSAP